MKKKHVISQVGQLSLGMNKMSEIRKVNLMDAFHVSAILKKIDLNIDAGFVQEAIDSADDEDEAMLVLGQEVLQNIIKNFHLAQDEIFSWLLDFKEGLTIEEIKYMPINEIVKMVKEKFSGEDMGAFFKSLLQTEEK